MHIKQFELYLEVCGRKILQFAIYTKPFTITLRIWSRTLYIDWPEIYVFHHTLL